MSNEEIDIAIAEARGWTEIRHYASSDDGPLVLGGHRPGTPHGCWSWLPNCHSSLDDIAEAVAAIASAQRKPGAWIMKYHVVLACLHSGIPISKIEPSYNFKLIGFKAALSAIDATATERCYAVLYLLGKWRPI